jgi:hypothetical protein
VDKGRGLLADWKVYALAGEALVAAACLFFGWQLAHPGGSTAPARIEHPQAAPAVPGPRLLDPPAPRPPGAHRPPWVSPDAFTEFSQRLNQENSALYQGQWQTLQLVAAATREYLERRVLPLLLAAARGGLR